MSSVGGIAARPLYSWSNKIQVAGMVLVLFATMRLHSSNYSSIADAINRESCEKILDMMDDTYNQRRKPRHSKNNTGWTGHLIFDLFEPEATCISEERFGSDSEERYDAFGDGPKFVCGVDYIAAKAKKADCLIYSVGSNNDVRFEKAVHTHMKGCEVHTFDPTVADDAFIGGEYTQFHSWGLGTDGGTEGISMSGLDKGSRKSFETVVRDLGHDKRTIDILKIDCEGCESATMPPLFDLIVAGEITVNQILVELHRAGFEDSFNNVYDFFLAADRAKFRVTHKERNHWGCRGESCVEYAFTSESYLRDINEAIICPGNANV